MPNPQSRCSNPNAAQAQGGQGRSPDKDMQMLPPQSRPRAPDSLSILKQLQRISPLIFIPPNGDLGLEEEGVGTEGRP